MIMKNIVASAVVFYHPTADQTKSVVEEYPVWKTLKCLTIKGSMIGEAKRIPKML